MLGESVAEVDVDAGVEALDATDGRAQVLTGAEPLASLAVVVEVLAVPCSSAALNASAASWPFNPLASACPLAQAATVSAPALHLSCNCWHMKLLMTPILSAEP